MATYAQFRTALQDELEALVPATLVRVYAHPPAKIEDEPSVAMLGSSGRGMFSVGEGSLTDVELTEVLRIYVQDYDPDVAAAELETIRAAIITAITANNGMDGTGTIYALEWDTPAGFSFGGDDFVGQTLRLSFVLN